jgi:hypothetical protein
MSEQGGSKRNAQGEIVHTDDMTTPVARHVNDWSSAVVDRSVAIAVSSEKQQPSADGLMSTTNKDTKFDDDCCPVDKSPRVLKNRPPFTSVYNFISKDLVIFKGKLHLCFHCEEDKGISKRAYGAYCEICDDEFAYNTVSNPHTLTAHARQVHAKEIVRMREEQLERELAFAKSQASLRINKQTTLTAFAHSEGSKFPLAGKSDMDKFRYKTAVWIGSRLLPFARVEDPELQDMIDFCCALSRKRVTPPPCQEASDLISCIATASKDVLRESMKKEIDYYSITTDMWTSKSMSAYMATTIHYMTDDFRLKQYTLDVCPFDGRHTGDLIGSKLEKCLFQQWELPKLRMAMMVRDSGSNIVKACNDYKFEHMPCVGHQLHLILGPFVLDPKPTKKQTTSKRTNAPQTSTTGTDSGTPNPPGKFVHFFDKK